MPGWSIHIFNSRDQLTNAIATLTDALASEGPAQHFLHEMMDCPPEPWEEALNPQRLTALSKIAA